MQLDNQLLGAHSHVVLARPLYLAGDKSLDKPLLEVRWEKVPQASSPNTHMFRYFSILLQEIDLTIEEEFLDTLLHYFVDFPLADFLGGWSEDDEESEQ